MLAESSGATIRAACKPGSNSKILPSACKEILGVRTSRAAASCAALASALDTLSAAVFVTIRIIL